MKTPTKHKRNPERSFSSSQINIIIVSILIIVTLIIYWQVKDFNFINFDDEIYVTKNEIVKSGLNQKSIAWAFNPAPSKIKTYWHPASWLSHMLDVQLFGLNPAGHHLTNVFFHLLNSFLLFLLLKLMTGAVWRSAIVAALFAWHPINVDSVAWIAERKNVLSTCFLFLTLLSYQRYAKSPNKTAYMVTLAFFIAGLLSKPMLITLPFILLLLDYWPLRRFNRNFLFAGHMDETASLKTFKSVPIRTLLIEKIPFFVISIALIWMVTSTLSSTKISLSAVPLSLRISNAIVSYVLYAYKLIWPFNLAVYYPFPESIPDWQVAASAGLLITMTSIFALSASKRPYLLIGWLWYLGTMVPASGLIQSGLWPALADRWAYVPGIGFFIVIVWGGAYLFQRLQVKKSLSFFLPALLLGALIVISWQQASHWQNSRTLFQHAIAVTGENEISNNNYALALLEQDRPAEAIAFLKRAVAINPTYTKSYYNIGIIHSLKNRYADAITYFKKAIAHDKHYVMAHKNLAYALNKTGQINPAIDHFEISLKLEPNDPSTLFRLAMLYRKAGREKDAYTTFKEAVRINPNHYLALNEIGLHFITQDEMQKAVTYFLKAHEMAPNNMDIINNVSAAFISMQKMKKALAYAAKALQASPFDPASQKYFLTAVKHIKKQKDAISTLERALKQNPENVFLLKALGDCYQKQALFGKAIQIYERVYQLAPQSIDGLNALAVSYARNGDVVKALDVFFKLIKLDPQNARLHYNIACVYAMQNDIDNSILWLEKAVQKGYRNQHKLRTASELDNIRHSDAFKRFMDKHYFRVSP